MEYNRRKFLQHTALVAGAVLAAPQVFGKPSKFSPGLQLYTVRDAMAKDPKGTLQKVADVGYKVLETASYKDGKFYGFSASEFAKITNDLGMQAVSSHIGLEEVMKNLNQILEAMQASGQKYLVIPWLGDSYRNADGYKKLADDLNEKGATCKNAGIKLAYHNHDFEFKDLGGTNGMDILLNITNRDLVNFESDLYWVTKAGLNPLEFIKKYPGRFPLWHVKDMANTPEKGFAEVGTGTIDYNSLFENADVAGLDYFFVEQDRSDDPLKSIQISYKGVKKIL
ncbi:MAG: sugar phosphate isomerase/epimerase family protein [Bacteroidota bacterium]